MSDGPELLDDKARTPSERVEPSHGMCSVDPFQRPTHWEWLSIGVVVWSLFVAACIYPVYIEPGWSPDGLGPPSRPVFGWELLLQGWILGLLFLPLFIPWGANVLMLQGWIFYLRGRVQGAAVCGGLAAIAGLTAYTVPRGDRELLTGFYLWQASLFVFAAASAGRWWRKGIAAVEANVPEPCRCA